MNESRRRTETEAQRRRRLAEVLGDALPEGTRDDSPDAWGDREVSGRDDDERLRREVPPHHG